MSERIWFERFPAALVARDQWVMWRYVERDGRPTKVPFQPNGQHARTDDPSTWSSLAACRAARAACIGHWEAVTYDGVGYVFSADDPFVGIDLDKCRGEQWAADFVAQWATYTEITPSWRGYHLIGLGTLPGGKGRRKGAVELYDRGRFFTMTGVTYPQAPAEPQPVQGALDALLAEWTPPRRGTVPRTAPAEADDQTVLERALRAQNGATVGRLYAGDATGHDTPSQADAALIALLIPYTRDAAQLDRLFRGSGLMRAKWDEMRGTQTYGALTIAQELTFVTFDARRQPPDRTPWWERPAL